MLRSLTVTFKWPTPNLPPPSVAPMSLTVIPCTRKEDRIDDNASVAENPTYWREECLRLH